MDYSDQTLKELAELSLRLAHNDKTRERYVELVQEDNPNFKAPDIEAKKAARKVDELREELKLEKQREQALSKMESQKQKLIDSNRYSDEDMGKIENFMQEKGIADYEDAATLYSSRHAPAPSTPEIKTSRWEMPAFKGLMENPNKWASDEAHRVIGEFRNNRR